MEATASPSAAAQEPVVLRPGDPGRHSVPAPSSEAEDCWSPTADSLRTLQSLYFIFADPSGSVPKLAKAVLKEDRRESTETAALTEGCAGDAVAATAWKKAPQAVVGRDFDGEVGEIASRMNSPRARLGACRNQLKNR